MLYIWYSNQIVFFHPIFWWKNTRTTPQKNGVFQKAAPRIWYRLCREVSVARTWMIWMTTSRDRFTPKWWWFSQGNGTPCFRRNLGWWNIRIWPGQHGDRLSLFCVWTTGTTWGVPIIQGLKNSCGKRPLLNPYLWGGGWLISHTSWVSFAKFRNSETRSWPFGWEPLAWWCVHLNVNSVPLRGTIVTTSREFWNISPGWTGWTIGHHRICADS